jgi:hypothetical protein
LDGHSVNRPLVYKGAVTNYHMLSLIVDAQVALYSSLLIIEN